MKKVNSRILYVFIVISGLLLGSCQSDTSKKIEKAKDEVKEMANIPLPAKINLTQDEIMLRDQEKAQQKVLKVKKKMAAEAVEAVMETQNAVQLLSANKKLEAIKNLNNALRKIETVTHKYPELKLLPVSVDVRRNELITDINTVNKIRKEAYKALKNEDVQEARALLSGLSSEIDISSVNIPLATYPDAIKKAIQLVNSEKINEAQIVLLKALNGLVIVNKIIPIPLLNAGVMIEEANRLYLEDRSANIDEVANLLENAEYQLKLSEALGYSKGKKTYKELARDIVKLKKSAKANSDIKEALDKLHLDIIDFSESIY